MKLFNRSKESEEEVPEAQEAAEAPQDAPAPGEEQQDDASEELAAMLDASVKEISEKIARLSSNVESSQEARNGLEEKLLRMEDRMRKLSSLTEMISSQYNPFLGDTPLEEDADAGPAGIPDVSEGMPPPFPTLETGVPAPPPAEDETASPQGAAPAVEEMPPPPTPAPAPPAPQTHTDDASDEWAPEDVGAPELVDDAADAPHEDAHEAASEPEIEADAADATGARLPHVRANFQNSMLMLKWADALLGAAGTREGLADLLGYYESIQWISNDVREQLLAYAEGLSVDAHASDRDWRADVDMHERSLLYIEKLRGCGKP